MSIDEQKLAEQRRRERAFELAVKFIGDYSNGLDSAFKIAQRIDKYIQSGETT
jgi:hypothetical protein